MKFADFFNIQAKVEETKTEVVVESSAPYTVALSQKHHAGRGLAEILKKNEFPPSFTVRWMDGDGEPWDIKYVLEDKNVNSNPNFHELDFVYGLTSDSGQTLHDIRMSLDEDNEDSWDDIEVFVLTATITNDISDVTGDFMDSYDKELR